MLRHTRPDGPGTVARHPALVGLVALVFVLIGSPGVARAQAPPAAAAGTTILATGSAAVINTDRLNLRAAASPTAAVVAVLPDGTWATVTAAPTTAGGVTWYPLNVDGTAGWSDATYLAPAVGDAALLPANTVVAVNTDRLNLRAAAGLGQPVATVLTRQAAATVLAGPASDDGLAWYQLNAGGVVGWAARPYLAFAPPNATAFAVGQSVLINTNVLRLRAAAGLSGAVVTTLPGGTTATVVAGPQSADGYDWYQIQLASGTGWVAGSFLRTP